jgi:hypothetical protein
MIARQTLRNVTDLAAKWKTELDLQAAGAPGPGADPVDKLLERGASSARCAAAHDALRAALDALDPGDLLDVLALCRLGRDGGTFHTQRRRGLPREAAVEWLVGCGRSLGELVEAGAKIAPELDS